MSKGDLTRQRIVALAAPLFNQRGFEGCSMQDDAQPVVRQIASRCCKRVTQTSSPNSNVWLGCE